MASWIVITGVPPWDGRYEYDIGADLTQREWGWVKKYAGYASPLDFGPNAFVDPEMVGVFALCALHRNGKILPRDIPEVWERFQDAPFPSSITVERDEEPVEADADPPPGSSSESLNSNGAGTPTVSVSLEDPLSPTGIPSSDTSGYDRATSVS